MKRIKWIGFAVVAITAGMLMTCTAPLDERPGPEQNMAVVIGAGEVMPYPNLCKLEGTVVKSAVFPEECGLNILLDNGELLYPYSFLEPFDLVQGQRVRLDYEQLDVLLPLCEGIPVLLTCIREISVPSADLCLHLGIIRNYGDCGTVIESIREGLVYYPIGLEADWPDGQRIVFGYKRVDAPVPPCDVLPVIVTCIAPSKWDR